MRVLLFLILGTLIFGFAFPTFILAAGFFLLIFIALTIVGLFTGLFRGGHVIVYRNGRRVDTYRKSRDTYTADNPEVITGSDYTAGNIHNHSEDADGEVIELPASALSKEDGDEN